MELRIPNVGATVKVVTKYRNSYIYSSEPWVYYTHEGTVVPSNKWDQPNTFNMTGDVIIPIRNISANNIESLEVLTGTARKLVSGVRVFKVKSKSKNNEYIVTLNNSKYSCTCVGFQFRRHCKHAAAVAAKVQQ